jgi:hypothetical protein
MKRGTIETACITTTYGNICDIKKLRISITTNYFNRRSIKNYLEIDLVLLKSDLKGIEIFCNRYLRFDIHYLRARSTKTRIETYSRNEICN